MFSPCHAIMNTVSLQREQNKTELKKIFVTFYVEQLVHRLEEIVCKECKECKKGILDRCQHQCYKYKTPEKAFRDYGTRAIEELYMSDLHRWLVTKKFWSAVFEINDICDNVNCRWISDAKVMVTEIDMFIKVGNEWVDAIDKKICNCGWLSMKLIRGGRK